MVGGFTKSISSFTYRTFFKKESTYFTTVVASGVAFSIAFNTMFEKYWDNKTAGTKWIDIKDRYAKDSKLGQLSSNEALTLAGTFHGIHVLASRISPATKGSQSVKDSGIQTIDTKNFRIHCYQTPTGIKFMAATDLLETKLSDVLVKMYGLYSDYALKNPFYNLEMPIRSEMFDSRLVQLVKTV
ncbi:hypothetical protein LPJ64_003185 [Coemansia asiatica]|uniref:Trafficking protein particle complex subunit n=1 Tax=Coemansia asiatica TaxID=1052880 RepID=A0A9W7XLI6_9FUNG|nr:hypothetical protein LPJ64_003185 [Coemansia asiatica]